MDIFSAKSVKLEGTHLIEASAGTGKTYSIAAIFLRLILLGSPIQSILVVTFTQAATAELKNRLLDFLRKAYNYASSGKIEDGDILIKEIVELYNFNKIEIIKRLNRAIMNFDNASVFTIHGFCSKIIRENAFESGTRFNLELNEDYDQVLEEAVIDFWRKYNALSDEKYLTEAVNAPWFSIKELKKLLKGKLFSEKPGFIPSITCKELSWEKNRAVIESEEESNNAFCVDSLILLDRLFDEVAETLSKRREKTGKMSFDDLLWILESSLSGGKLSKQLIKVIEKKYMTVLIDEFQDTDPVQYKIFKTLFGNGTHTLFYIGDPKQSIYSFRNADVFAYLKVKNTPGISEHSLDTNYRSSKMAVKAVNTLFEKLHTPFIIEDIGYSPVKARDSESLNDLKIRRKECHGLEIRFLSPSKYKDFHLTVSKKEPEKRKIKLEKAKASSIDDMCLRIIEIIDENSEFTIFDKEKNLVRIVKPSDIAVLVLTNKNAEAVKKAFDKKGIPAVLASNSSVFETKEARDILILMEAVKEPSPSKIKALLLTSFYTKTMKDIDIITKMPSEFELWQNYFSGVAGKWETSGFLASFSEFINSSDIYTNLAKNGERTLTNIRHLLELINKEEIESGRSIDFLINRVKEKMLRPGQGEDEQIRLENDENSVRILTVHKSKGLEFNIVFCPDFIRKAPKKNLWNFYYHDNNYRQVLSFDTKNSIGRISTENETMSENLRLLYVALTRAKCLTVIYWGCLNGVGTSPLTKVLFNITEDDIYNKSKESELLEKVLEIAERSENSIIIETELKTSGSSFSSKRTGLKLRPACILKREIKRNWSITSFSAIGASKSGDHFSKEIDFSDESEENRNVTQSGKVQSDISFFPSGTSAGTVLHSVFEIVDFNAEQNTEKIMMILDQFNMRLYKNGSDMLPWVESCVNSVLSAPVFNGFSLKQIKRENSVSELEFFYPSEQVNLKRLNDIIGNMVNLSDGSMAGFVHGFIDLVFKHEGKYYLLDWKSNRLGSDFSFYTEDALKKEMKKHNYVLQYMLYLAAFDKYISTRDPDYSYENNFGGVYYIFLRGVTPENGYTTGIYKDLPDIEVLRKLQKLFSGENN